MGKNLSNLFENEKDYTLELIRLWREIISSELNCDIKPIEFIYNEELENYDVQIVDKIIDDLQFLHNEIKIKKDVPKELIDYYNSIDDIENIINQDKVIIKLKFDNTKDKSLEWLLMQLTISYKKIYELEKINHIE